ncbi:MAG: carboxypeptidase regulatory-like domain-containing protein, partial [Bryobacteraceae bacterium]
MSVRFVPVLCLAAFLAVSLCAQSIQSGTVVVTVHDPSGAVVSGADLVLRNPVTGYAQHVLSDPAGSFRFNNVPRNNYQLSASSAGFATATQTLAVNGSRPVMVDISLQLLEEATSVNVAANGSMVEADTSAHQDADRSSFLTLPSFDPGAQLSQAITYSTGAVAADANGFFHPLGDHAQTSFVIDGQSISDQQSKVFSTQIPANALQSMELITGSPDAQYGDKTSLVVNAITRSGLGAAKTFGSVDTTWGSFGTWDGSASLGVGNTKFGNFVVLNATDSGHFLDTPEFQPIHDRGNNESVFDRFDWQPDGKDSIHLDLFAARNWFQVPNSYDQLSQDQKQRVLTWNIAPGYQHTFNANTLLTINAYARRDQVDYYASANPFDDTPITASQQRFLTNYGANVDLAYQWHRHNLKVGTQIHETPLVENFQFAVTDPEYNPVCINANGTLPSPLLAGVTNPALCSSINPAYTANPNLQPGIVPYDLTRGGSY